MPRMTANHLKGGEIIDVQEIDDSVGPITVLVIEMPRVMKTLTPVRYAVYVQSDPEGNGAGYLQIEETKISD